MIYVVSKDTIQRMKTSATKVSFLLSLPDEYVGEVEKRALDYLEKDKRGAIGFDLYALAGAVDVLEELGLPVDRHTIEKIAPKLRTVFEKDRSIDEHVNFILRELRNIRGRGLPIPTVAQYMRKAKLILNLPDETINEALKLVEKIKEAIKPHTTRTRVLVSVAIYLADKKHAKGRKPVTQKDLWFTLGSTEITMRLLLRKLRNKPEFKEYFER